MTKKYLSMLGLARRAGRLAMGHDMVCDAIRKRKARLLVFTADSSARLREEIGRLTDRYCPALPCVTISETMDEIHCAIGYRAGVMAVNDSNFSARIAELTEQEENAYGNKN